MRSIDICPAHSDGPVTINITVGCTRPDPALLLWTFGPVLEQKIARPKKRYPMVQLTETQMVVGVVQPVTAKGNPAQVQAGSSVFTSSEPGVVSVEVDQANELKVTVKAQAPGAAQVRWSADADLGDGVRTISAVADFVVVAGMAVGATINFGVPTEQV